ncbi:Non-LTR retroelement reverse transcriptase [Sesbania bispinosa]|nr:Non-LTR retroelement reverse transcriptase [Sesbania bispinosa]
MPHLEDVKEEASPFDPWMIVKRQQRKRAPTQAKQSFSKEPVQEATERNNGSRFSLLKQVSTDEVNNSVVDPQASNLKTQTIRVRDPAAGKNSQKSQMKKQVEGSSISIPEGSLTKVNEPSQNSESISKEEKFRMEQDHLLTMRLIQKKAAERREILVYPNLGLSPAEGMQVVLAELISRHGHLTWAAPAWATAAATQIVLKKAIKFAYK